MRDIIQSILLKRLNQHIDVSTFAIAEEIEIALQNRTQVLTCVYCGHEYPPGTPKSNHESLTAHIEVCEKHPMSQLMAKTKLLHHKHMQTITLANANTRYWMERASAWKEALDCTRKLIHGTMQDCLGKELYERCYGEPEKEKKDESESTERT
jgi:hypothetical protein